MLLEAFTDELVNGPGRESLVKVARLDPLIEKLIAAGALTGLVGHGLKKVKHRYFGGPYEPPPRGTVLGSAGTGGLAGLVAALGLKGISRIGRRR